MRLRELMRSDGRVLLLVAAVLTALGAPLGVMWAFSVPDLAVVHAGSRHGYLLPVATEDHADAAGDLVMVLILLIAGVVAGAVVAWLGRRAPVGAALGLLFGGAIGGAIALAVGHVIVHGDYGPVYHHSADYQTVFQVRPYVRGTVDLVILPLVALLVFGTVEVLRTAFRPAPVFPPPAPQA